MIQQDEFKMIFPQTLESLRVQNLDSLLGDFHRFCLNDLTQGSDAKGWFPVFLKAQGVAPELTEICHYEWLKFSCVAMDWGKPRLDQGQIGLAPGVQFINIEKAAQSLSYQPGLRAVFSRDGKAFSKSLSAAEALCLDTLAEDRKFTQPQLVEYLKMEGQDVLGLQKTDWPKIIDQLCEEKLLLSRD